MTMPQLLPGDVLLYRGRGFWSWAIRVKTWSDVSHCECYIGGGKSVASRDGVGVGTYPLRLEGLVAVLRPKAPFDLAAALAWHATVEGQGYDWVGLMNFYVGKWRGKENGKQFCAEQTTRFQRHGTIEPFHPEFDADCVAPGMFFSSAAYTHVPVETVAA